MGVSIKQIMALDSFRSVRVLAGADYLDNEVRRISTADLPVSEIDYLLAQEGDFFLSGFYFVGDDLAEMQKTIECLVNTDASGLCLTDEFIQSLPPEIAAYCEKKRLPVLIINHLMPYGDMFRDVTELILLDQKKELVRAQLETLLTGSLNVDTKMHLIRQLNPHFQNRVIAFYLPPNPQDAPSEPGHKRIDMFNRDTLSFGAEFRSGALGLVSHNQTAAVKIKALARHYVDEIRKAAPTAFIGVSAFQNHLSDCDVAIRQALTAGMNSLYADGPGVAYYEDLGAMKLILLLHGRPELHHFVSETLNPLSEYDEKNQADLLETMTVFIKNDRNPQKAAAAMFVHVNTIRYRVCKAKEIVAPGQSMNDFLESFTIASKIYKLTR